VGERAEPEELGLFAVALLVVDYWEAMLLLRVADPAAALLFVARLLEANPLRAGQRQD
jgi:hypothetical protein